MAQGNDNSYKLLEAQFNFGNQIKQASSDEKGLEADDSSINPLQALLSNPPVTFKGSLSEFDLDQAHKMQE